MEKEFDIQAYMTAGVERIVKDSLKATLKDPKGSAFMMNVVFILYPRRPDISIFRCTARCRISNIMDRRCKQIYRDIKNYNPTGTIT